MLVKVVKMMSVRRILPASLMGLVLTVLLLLLSLTHVNAATAPTMGAAASFAVLGGSTVTNTGNTVIIGDLGLYPGTSITGFLPGIVVPPGTIHQTDIAAQNAQSATTVAYLNLASQGPGTPEGPDLTNLNLGPGVYSVGAAATNLHGLLTLSGSGIWIFLMSSSLVTTAGAAIAMTDSPCNVFWHVDSDATIAGGTTFLGSILAYDSISVGNAATVNGRLLAQIGAVTLINDLVNDTSCVPLTPGGVGVSKIFSPDPISAGGVSTLTITFTNTNAAVATLTSPFTDNLPSGVVIASPSNVATTCGGGGAPTATPGGSAVTLPTGDTIPAGTVAVPGFCTLTVDVTSLQGGSHINTLGAGVLVTNKGNNLLVTAPAGATLNVLTSPTLPEYPLGLPLLAIFMIITYGLVKRRASARTKV